MQRRHTAVNSFRSHALANLQSRMTVSEEDADNLSRRLHLKSREKTQLNDASLPGSQAGQFTEGVVQRDDLG